MRLLFISELREVEVKKLACEACTEKFTKRAAILFFSIRLILISLPKIKQL